MPPFVRPYLRISLRSAFVVMTVCAVWMGFESIRARDHLLAVHRILELGGRVDYDFQFDASGRPRKNAQPPKWPWLRRLVGGDYFQSVVSVSVRHTPITDADMKLIGKLGKLRSLELINAQISDDGLRQLQQLRNLRGLAFTHTQISDRGLQYLAPMDLLDHLVLEDNGGVGDEGLQHLSGLKRLTTLNLDRTSVTSAGLSRLASLSQLQFLWLQNTTVDDAAIPHIIKLGSLRELGLSGSKLSGPGMLTIQESLPSCVVDGDMIDLRDSKNIGTQDTPQRWLRLRERLQALNDEGRLKLLNLSGTNVTNDHLLDLHQLGHLEAIDLRGTRVTEAGVQELERALPGCKCVR